MINKTISGQHNGFDFIEIGGIKWATYNVGAEKPTDAGLYFQWGDRKGYTFDEVGKIKMFNRQSYKHDNGKCFTKYNGFDKKRVLDLRDDGAFAYMGQGWRVPTREDFRCLVESTTHRWTDSYQDSGIPGMVFTDITDNTKELFFPAAGKCVGGKAYYVGHIGYYWSGSLYSGNVLYSCIIHFNNDFVYCDVFSSRYQGFPIRGILTD